MKNELVIRQCDNCKATVKVIKDCNCQGGTFLCCGKEMTEVVPNSVDAVVEKHVPTYEVKDGKVFVKVNHVMEEEHYIEWICMVNDKKECIKYFKHGETCETHFKYIPDSILYAYCNKHGLWKKHVE